MSKLDGRGRAGVLRIGNGYACSIGGQTLRNRCANAPGTAGNECYFLRYSKRLNSVREGHRDPGGRCQRRSSQGCGRKGLLDLRPT